MLNGKKIIGLCATKIHDTSHLEYTDLLHNYAKEHGFKLIVFNSFLDFYNNDDFDEGAKAIYNMMNFDILDAVILLYDSFCNKSVALKIISDARANNVPVILLNGKAEGCISVIADYTDGFKRLMDHVIKVHGVTDTFFIAGKPDPAEDPDSAIRIQCYREVLEENGLHFDMNKVDYGYYWDEPASDIVKRITDGNKKPPRAIFCANDDMAVAVCKTLKKLGYTVPDDVIVTGFDGVPASWFYSPHISTCRTNIDRLAQASLEAAETAISGKDINEITVKEHEPIFTESCGCDKSANDNTGDYTAELFHTLAEVEAHEDYMYSWIDKNLGVTDLDGLYKVISERLISNSYLCLKNSYINSITEISMENTKKSLPGDFVVIPPQFPRDEAEKIGSMSRSDMLPYIEKWLGDDSFYILNSIYIGKEVCGFYALRAKAAAIARHKLQRVVKVLNVALNICTNYFKQVNMRIKIENAAFINPISGMPNVKGAIRWFEKFSAKAESHNKCVAFSVYGLPKFMYIYENFGIESAEEAVRLVSERLKTANTDECFIAHITEDEFLVINYADDGYAIGEAINKATSTFFSLNDSYNANSGNPYFVEVNCGCTIADPGWNGELEGFIGFANNEMYMNRLKMGTDAAVKKYENPGVHYKAFDLLIKKNLFSYYFQPIVNAKSGEIYAYEALMRTDASIGMNPLQVLDTAKEYNKLYDIEKATMFNIIGRFANEHESFGNAKVFINTIPGHFLNDSDIDELSSKYGKFMDRFVFELTEQDTVSDEELESIRRLIGVDENHIAIDDFGTGHSNIVNLMRYSPEVIKIDRFLISDIHKNQNKQMFVRSTIEFAKMNNIKVLAEGVETSNELRMVIDLGVDLIQGYYTGRPAPDPVPAIAAEIKKEIVESNPLYGQKL